MDLEGWSGAITPVIGRSAGMLSRSPELRGQPGALALALAHRLLHRRELGLEPGLALVEAGLERGDLVVDVARLVAGLLGADVEQAARRLGDRVEQGGALRADALRRVRHERLDVQAAALEGVVELLGVECELAGEGVRAGRPARARAGRDAEVRHALDAAGDAGLVAHHVAQLREQAGELRVAEQDALRGVGRRRRVRDLLLGQLAADEVDRRVVLVDERLQLLLDGVLVRAWRRDRDRGRAGRLERELQARDRRLDDVALAVLDRAVVDGERGVDAGLVGLARRPARAGDRHVALLELAGVLAGQDEAVLGRVAERVLDPDGVDRRVRRGVDLVRRGLAVVAGGGFDRRGADRQRGVAGLEGVGALLGARERGDVDVVAARRRAAQAGGGELGRVGDVERLRVGPRRDVAEVLGLVEEVADARADVGQRRLAGLQHGLLQLHPRLGRAIDRHELADDRRRVEARGEASELKSGHGYSTALPVATSSARDGGISLSLLP